MYHHGFTAIYRIGIGQDHRQVPHAGLDIGPHRILRAEDGHAVSTWHQASVLNTHVQLALSGKVCNVQALRLQLGVGGGVPLPQLMIAGYRRWSTGLFAHVDGVFALALQAGDELFLYRDPSGLASLYHADARPDGITFSTSLLELVNALGAKPTISRASLHEYLRFGDITSPNTVLAGVCAAEPGQLFHWTASGLEPVHSPQPGLCCNEAHDFAAAVDTLDAAMQRSVNARIADARAPAAFLSGGVDSSLLCALAARSRPDVTAVTVGFEGAEFDETPVAARIAAHLGLRHEVLRFAHDEVLGAFERLVRHADQPFADPTGPVTLLAFEHCRERYDVVLDGTGADSAVGAMPPRHLRLAVGWLSRLPMALRLEAAGWLKHIPPLAGYATILDCEHPADTMIRWKGFTRTEIEALYGEARVFRTHDALSHVRTLSAPRTRRALQCANGVEAGRPRRAGDAHQRTDLSLPVLRPRHRPIHSAVASRLLAYH
jgi:asparagine synthase (glutamine-hydrolysing)